MKIRRRVFVLLFAGLSILALAILASALTGLQLRPGQPFPLFFNPPGSQDLAANLPGSQLLLAIWRWIYILALLLLPFSIIYMILSPEGRKQFLRILRQFIPLLILLPLISNALKKLGENIQAPEVPEGGMLLPPYPIYQEPAASFSDQVPAWLVILTSLVVSLVLLSLVFLLIRALRRKDNLPHKPLAEIGEEAQLALEALKQGADLKNVVIRCYFQMNKVLNLQRGIFRDETMTPREFVQALEGKGLPREPVRKLTQLFEAARYGLMVPGRGEENQAIDSLTAIVDYCKDSG